MSFDLKLEDGDLKLGPTKDLSTVENEEKLIQDILKIVTTDLGSNRFHPWYGCPISKSMIGRVFDTTFVRSVASSQLNFSLTTLQKLQQEQAREDQILTPQESIAAIQGVNIDQNRVDPRFFNIEIAVLNKAFRRLNPSFGLRL